MDHLMAEKNENNKDSQKGQVTLKKHLKKKFLVLKKSKKILRFLYGPLLQTSVLE